MAFKNCNQFREWHCASVQNYPAYFTLHFYNHLKDDKILLTKLAGCLCPTARLSEIFPSKRSCKELKFGTRPLALLAAFLENGIGCRCADDPPLSVWVLAVRWLVLRCLGTN